MQKKMFAKFKENDIATPSKIPNRKIRNEHLNFKSIIADLTTTKSILSKMVLVFLLLIIIPVSTIGFITTNTASKNLLKSTEDSVVGATRQTSDYFDAFLDKAQNISIQIIANKMIQDFSRKDTDIKDQSNHLIIQQNAMDALNGINSISQDMNTKLLYNNGLVLGDIRKPEDMGKVMAADWYRKVKEADGKPIWIDCSEAMKDTGTDGYALSLLRLYKDPATSENSGIVIVDVSYVPVKDILSGIKLGKSDTTYLLTQEGKVLSAKGQSEEGALAQRKFIREVQERSAKIESDKFYTKDNDVNYLVSYYKSPRTRLTIVTIVPGSAITAGAVQIMKTTIYAGILFVLLAGAIGFIFSLGMTLTMKSIMDVMARAEVGDLTVSLTMKRQDEFGRLVTSFNRMLVKIRELVMQNKQAADEVVASSEKMTSISSESSRISTEIAHAIVEVAAGSSNQASEIEASVKNVSQLADRITMAVKKTKDMETDSTSMKELSNYGIATIDSLSRRNAQTNEITSSVVKDIAQLNQYVKNIDGITRVLRSIADQTNLLALNASIEAARVGESGKGFAVVADEMRKLAEESNNQIHEIQKHVEDIFKQAQSTTGLVGKAEESIRVQSEMVGQTAEVFSRINETTTCLTENIGKVGDMITDMDSFKERVMSSMENISAVSEQVSASSQEVSASTEEQLASVEQLDDMSKKLNELAGDLIMQMERFKI